MPGRPELRRILYTISDLAHNDTSASIIDLAIEKETKLSNYDLDKMLSELSSLGLIEIFPKPTGANFKLVSITPKGLEELQSPNK